MGVAHVPGLGGLVMATKLGVAVSEVYWMAAAGLGAAAPGKVVAVVRDKRKQANHSKS